MILLQIQQENNFLPSSIKHQQANESSSLSWYSRLPIIRTFKENRKKFELSRVRVIEGKVI